MASGKAIDWHSSPGVTFPRVTMCDFKVRRLGNVHRYTVQCTLPLNMYNEMIYTFIWFWMVFVGVITAISLVTWLLRACMKHDRIRYVQNHLRRSELLETEEDVKASRKFVTSYLRADGVFLLRLIGHNTSPLMVTDIAKALWKDWIEKRGPVAPTTSTKTPYTSVPDHYELHPLNNTKKEKEK